MATVGKYQLIALIKNNKAKDLELAPAIRLFMVIYFNAVQPIEINKKPEVDLLKLVCYLR